MRVSRYGLPKYRWRWVPVGLVTRPQLTGRRLGGQLIVALLVGLDAGLAARPACSSCGRARPYCIAGSLGECGLCAAGQVAA